MRFLLVCVLLVWSNLLALGLNDKSDLKYLITINDENRGVLYMNLREEGTSVKYHGISKNDKILFYADNKNYTLKKVLGLTTLDDLKVDGFDNSFIYDLAQASADMVEESGLSAVDMQNSIIILDDKEGLPSYTLEKYAVHTMDSLIQTLFIDKSLLTQTFYLFEPQSNVLLKVAFAKDAKQKFSLGDMKCESDVYALSLVGKNKTLVNIYMGKVPYRIEANSKKWRFDLIGAGQPRQIVLNKSEQIIKLLKSEIQKDFKGKYSFKKLDVDYDRSRFAYTTHFQLSSEMDEDEVKKHLPTYIENYRGGAPKMGPKDKVFAYKVKYKDALKAYEKKYDVDIEDGKFYWKKGKIKPSIKKIKEFAAKKMGCSAQTKENDEVLCKDKDGKAKEKEFDVEDMIVEYIKSNNPEYDPKEIDLDDTKKTVYVVKVRKKMTLKSSDIERAARAVFKKKYEKLNFSRFPLSRDEDENYVIKISKVDVANKACLTQFKHRRLNGKKTTPSYHADDEKCYLQVQEGISSDKAESMFKTHLERKYPDLKWIDSHMTSDGADRVKFLYLDLESYKGQLNECHE